MESLQNLILQLKALPPTRRAVLAGTAVVSLSFFAWLTFGSVTPEYRSLYRGLEIDEAGRVTQALNDEKIPYQLADGGTSVLVPASVVHEARIRVARRGLPGGGGVGFELFDRPAFGVTDFVHRVNYTRAVQGELARSIEQLEPVERARVQVVIPERKSVLDEKNRRPSASAVVRLRPGRELVGEQVRAVVHMIASSIERLEPADVTVVDSNGRLLAPLEDGLPGSVAASGAFTYQEQIEANLEQRVESILSKTLGAGNVVARVRADIDWTESETTREIFDPESQVARSELRSLEETNEPTAATAGGAAGVISNLPDLPGGEETGPTTSSSTETINYEISKTVSRQVQPMGRIKRLSVALLVADKLPEAPDAVAEPWDVDTLSLFESIARQAVGFDEKRGDEISVKSAPFRTPIIELDDGVSFWPDWSPLLVAVARGAAALLALLVFARMVVRPVLDALPSPESVQLPARLSELEMAGGAPGVGAGSAAGALPDKRPNTEEGVRALRNWLNQG